MDVEINLWGVLAASGAAMVIGAVWYSKYLFGGIWMKLVKLNTRQAKKKAVSSMLSMFALSLVMAYVLAHVTYLSQNFFEDYSYLGAAMNTAFWVWLGFVVPTMIGTGLFEQRRKKLMAINACNWLATLLAMGWVIGLIGL